MHSSINKILRASVLPSHDEIFRLSDISSTVMENELCAYRPACDYGEPGGLLDFKGDPLPLIVVPDLHARPYFLENILDYKLSKKFLKASSCSVFEALEKGLVRIICVGDALHTERTTRERWAAAEAEFDTGICTGPAMSAEMLDGLSLICALMRLKELFPANFHFLKGNHENILNRTCDGDYAFRKFADEGRMVKEFISEYYGDDILYMLSCVENALPLIAVTDNCVISHGEPKMAFTRQQLINGRSMCEVVSGLTWTDNGAAEEGSVIKIIKELCGENDFENYVYLGGHRPVTENYLLRQNGRYIQIHNPGKQNIALVDIEKKFNPDTDIVSVEK